MAFNSDMLPILGNIFSDDRLAGDHRVLPGAAPPSIGSFIFGFFSRASATFIRSIGNSLGGGQELNLATPPSSREEGRGGAEGMGLIPPVGGVDAPCRRGPSPPVVRASMI